MSFVELAKAVQLPELQNNHSFAKMSAHVEVVSTDLRRAKVKVSPGTYLVDVLAEACKKLNLKSDKYELK